MQTAINAAAEQSGTATASQPTSGPVTVDAALSSITNTLLSIWESFLGHLPLLAAGLLVVIVTAIVAAIARRVVHRYISRSRLRRSLQELIEQMVYVVVWVVGLLLTAMIIFPGLTPTKALGGLGLLSVAVGFAFKDVFENFFAGVLLLWRFPFEPGDFIECEGIVGKVENVTIRMTTIRKPTDELIVVPNSFLFKNPVKVLTSRRQRRTSIIAGVAYDVEVEQAVSVIHEAVEQCETVSKDHTVQVFPQEFGSSSINIEVAWWCESTPLGVRESRGEVVTAVKKALDEHGLEIPFPYRTLTFKQPLPIERRDDTAGAASDDRSKER